MIGRAREFLQANAIVILAALLAMAIAVAGWQSVRIHGFGIWPFKVEGLQDKATRLGGEVRQLREDVKLSEAMRSQEQEQANTSYSDLSTRCEQRINTAREATQAIEEITNAESPASVPGVARPIVPAGQLRRVIGQD